MEAIGQLAGGIAHDYNNTLMAIDTYCELLLLELPGNEPMRKTVLEIQKAATRGADLTKQLLAFGRKQVLSPETLNLNQSITKTEDMLRRVISENIRLHIHLARDLGFVKADPGQIHQVILNLVLNARDAMPQGGELIIETENVDLDEEYVRIHAGMTPGLYVQLSISDTGIGIEESIISRIFEPFFTTKEERKGTGLGLSTVYGVVKQSGGQIYVYSQVGRGSTFKIYFPQVGGERAKDSPSVSTANLLGRGEVILLVDDNEAIANAVGALLKMKGYTIPSAQSGGEAMEISKHYAHTIHLLITDLVMPEMSGKELAGRLQIERPEMKILYVSGYTQEAINHQAELESGAAFLSKPATTQSLLTKIRKLLDLT